MKKTMALSLAICMIMSTITLFTACNKNGDSHEHSYEAEWTYNSTYHWLTCESDSCSSTSQKSKHKPVNGFCTICGFKNDSITNDNHIENNDSIEDIQAVACKYNIVSAPMNNGMIVTDSFRAGNTNYYYVDLGYAENVPIWSGIAVEYNKNQPDAPVLNFSKEMQNESSVEQSVANTLSKTVSESFSNTDTIEVGIEIGADDIASVNSSYQNSRTWGTAEENQNSTTSAFSTAQSVARSYGTSTTFTTGGCGYGYYRLSILATCDVYALMKTDEDNSRVLGITYAFCPRDNAVMSIEFSKDNTWIDDSAEKINIPQDTLKRLPAPSTVYEKYLTDSYKTSTDIAKVSDSDRTTVFNQSGSTSFNISVPDELKKFKELGCLYVEITAGWNSSLKIRSDYSTALVTINASFNNKGYTTVGNIEATGGGWPWHYVDPAYGDEITKTSSLCESYLVTDDTMFFTMDYQYIVDFTEYGNWAGGTNAVTYQINATGVSYRFFVGEP